jgi:hypothetical protein
MPDARIAVQVFRQFAQKVRAGLLAGPKAFLSEMMKNMAA